MITHNITDCLKELLHECGMKDFVIELSETNDDSDCEAKISFTFKIKGTDMIPNPFENIPTKHQVESLERQIDYLRIELHLVEKYKHYFELTKEMRAIGSKS